LKRARLALISLFLGGCGPHIGPPYIAPATIAWKVSSESLLEGPIGTDGQRLFATSREGGLIAVSLNTGRTLWHLEDMPGVLAARDDLVVLRQEDGILFGIDPDPGEIRWRTPTGVRGRLAAFLDGDRVIVAGEGLAAVDAATGALLWSLENAPTVSAVPSGGAGRIFLGEKDGTFRCRDSKTGRSLWTFSTASPILASATADSKGRVFLGTADRRLVCLKAEKGQLSWTRRIGADIDQAPVVAGDVVLVGTQEAMLYALERGSGDIRWRAPLPSRTLSPPLPLGQAVLVPCRESDIAAFDMKTSRRITVVHTTGEMRAAILLGDRIYLSERNPVSLTCLHLNVILGPPLPYPSPAPRRRH
jgi:outer membrane protein assembly factor BamB